MRVGFKAVRETAEDREPERAERRHLDKKKV